MKYRIIEEIKEGKNIYYVEQLCFLHKERNYPTWWRTNPFGDDPTSFAHFTEAMSFIEGKLHPKPVKTKIVYETEL